MTGAEVTVRRAEPGDADAIARVHVETWQGAYEHVFGTERLRELSAEERARGWQERLARRAPGTATFVASRGGQIVGFASVGPCRDDNGSRATGELYGIYVHPDAWGAGAGAALLEAAVGELRRMGHGAASLWVLDDNPRARSFYERQGWRLDGARKGDEFLGIEVEEVRYRRELGP